MNTEKLNELKKRINAIIDEAINDSKKEVDRPNIARELSQEEALHLMSIGYTVNFPSNQCNNNQHMIINGNVHVCECYESSNGLYSIDEWMDRFSHITGWRLYNHGYIIDGDFMTTEIFRKKLQGSDLPEWLKQALYEMADDDCLHTANNILDYVEELLQEIEELSD